MLSKEFAAFILRDDVQQIFVEIAILLTIVDFQIFQFWSKIFPVFIQASIALSSNLCAELLQCVSRLQAVYKSTIAYQQPKWNDHLQIIVSRAFQYFICSWSGVRRSLKVFRVSRIKKNLV